MPSFSLMRRNTIRKKRNDEAMRFVFDAFDDNKNGYLECREVEVLYNALRAAMLDSPIKVSISFTFPWMTFDQFKEQCTPYVDELQRMVDEFRTYDADGSGKVGAKDLEAIFFDFGLDIGADRIHRIVETVDKDKDGEICFKEFMEAEAKCFTSFL